MKLTIRSNLTKVFILLDSQTLMEIARLPLGQFSDFLYQQYAQVSHR
ncbi:MAG: hypothetical protein F6J90_22815 [Moorea sp. SIOASIH]|nr:hypothetical protein [Moorena sp. SIOASIH]NEO39014.1 hypothetical protein [Moorena sp. SIOASIH]NEO91860.1 hypothetical protein [Moorena sp. SIO3G5]